MRFVRYLYRNITPLNFLLLLSIAAIVVFVILPLFHMKVRYTLPAGKAKAEAQAEAPAEKIQSPSPADYVMIGENNLFHPERKIPPEKKDEKALPKPELVLYGTIIGGDTNVAYVEDKKSPRTTPGRGPRQMVVKKGDVLSGFIITGIEADRMVLVRGEETMTVHLSDEAKRRGEPGKKGAPGATAPGSAPGARGANATGGAPMRPGAPTAAPPTISPGQPGAPPTINPRAPFASRRVMPSPAPAPQAPMKQ